MAVLDPNVLFDVLRPTYNNSTGQTSTPGPFQSSYEGHLRQVDQQDYTWLPEGAASASHVLLIDEGLNLGEGDVLTNITREVDGQAYDDSIPPDGQVNSATVVWRVLYVTPTRPVSLSYRKAAVKKIISSGPTHP